MKLITLAVCAACVAIPSVEAAEFREARLEEEGSKLTIAQADGRVVSAHKIEGQDSFEKPAFSSTRRYVGWLALFPNKSASYAQPLYLVVLDSSGHTKRFKGDVGMVFGWCFTKDSTAVVYKYQFPHGATPIGFEMRRLKDGRMLRSFRLEPMGPDEDEDQVIRAKAPKWTTCAQASAAEQ